MGEGFERSKKDLSASRMDGGFQEPMDVVDPARTLRVFRMGGISSGDAASSSRSKLTGREK